jgi:hypothetical protein
MVWIRLLAEGAAVKDRFGENQRLTKLIGAERPAESGWTTVFENAEKKICHPIGEQPRRKK